MEDSGFLRDAAECLHRLNRNEEALKFLARAKERESENPFVLGLESRILEDIGMEPGDRRNVPLFLSYSSDKGKLSWRESRAGFWAALLARRGTGTQKHR